MHFSARDQFQKYVSNPKQKGLTNEQISNSLDSSVAGCEDHFKIFINKNKNKVEIARWEGKGCAISIGSTEALLNFIEGKEISEINNIINKYEKFINGEIETIDPELAVFKIIQTHVSRKKCALVAVSPIRKALNIENE